MQSLSPLPLILKHYRTLKKLDVLNLRTNPHKALTLLLPQIVRITLHIDFYGHADGKCSVEIAEVEVGYTKLVGQNDWREISWE